jgi:hypothetical protein
MDFAAAWARADQIDGWLTEAQARALYERALDAEGPVVEIGSHQGRSTTILAAASERVVAIDPWNDSRWGGRLDSFERFSANIAALSERVEVHRDLSQSVALDWSEPVAVLFIDGAHDLPSVLGDIDGWAPHVTGTLLIHDAFSSVGVTRAIMRRFAFSRNWRYARSVGSLAIFERADLSASGRIASTARMLARLPWFARNLLVKVFKRAGWKTPQRVLGHRSAGYPI